MPETTEAFRKRLEDWIAVEELIDTTIVTQAEWTKRGETACGFALLHLTSEQWQQIDELDAFADLCEQAGWEYDHHYAWSWHFWPIGYGTLVEKKHGSITVLDVVSSATLN